MNTEEPRGRELSEISPSQKDRPARPHLSEVSKTAKLTEAESRGALPGVSKRGTWGLTLSMGEKFQLHKMSTFSKPAAQRGATVNTTVLCPSMCVQRADPRLRVLTTVTKYPKGKIH